MSVSQLLARLDMAYGRNKRAVTWDREFTTIRAANTPAVALSPPALYELL